MTTFICPECAADLEPYGVENDVHTHWCTECMRPHILKDGEWIGTEEAFSLQDDADAYALDVRNERRNKDE
jgi:hypothetical protein